jgi:hypothetical protein
MTRFALMLAALVALTTPALALDYDCSPLTGGCTPRASDVVRDTTGKFDPQEVTKEYAKFVPRGGE